MKKTLIILSTIVPLLVFAKPSRQLEVNQYAKAIQCYTAAYPNQVCGGERDQLKLCDGSTIPIDDGLSGRSFEATLAAPDLLDQIATPYPLEQRLTILKNQDPGRARHLPFFSQIYGKSSEQVKKTLVAVPWLKGSKKSLKVTSTGGVSQALRKVVKEIEALPKEIKQKVIKTAGAFKWRKIAGTDRLSAHSFGIAVDIGGKNGDYWRWNKSDSLGRIEYRNRIPLQVVEIFERHGFIWGGKWYHYDTMHFEYRPELLHPACR